jgi:hypothetical protein
MLIKDHPPLGLLTKLAVILIAQSLAIFCSEREWRISLQGTLHHQQAQPFSEFVSRFRQHTDLLKSE